MNEPINFEHARDRRRIFSVYQIFVVALSVSAIVSTFLLSNSDLEVGEKTGGFAGILAGFLVACLGLHIWQAMRRPVREEEVSDLDVSRGLAKLDEASEFFSGILKSSDTFRLVTGRIRELIPFKAMVLFLLDGPRTHLRVAEVEGAGVTENRGDQISFDEGLAGQCFSRREVEVDHYMELDAQQDFASSVAIPLCNGAEVFGVLQLYFETDYDAQGADKSLFDAVGERVSPLMLAAIACERSQINALTDITTDLPNERAFYLILENQIAESVRKGDERPLTVLAIDIKGFGEINKRFGHSAGDRVLNFVAKIVMDNLRQMDFLARSIGDEFLAVLPTATKEISQEVITRIHNGFVGRSVTINDDESIEIDVNIGWATFGVDGETPGQLLSLAQLRKEQTKSTLHSKVLWFPQESAH